MTRQTVLTPTAPVMDTASPECVSAGRDGWEQTVARWTQLPANVCPGVVAMADWTVEGVSVISWMLLMFLKRPSQWLSITLNPIILLSVRSIVTQSARLGQ